MFSIIPLSPISHFHFLVWMYFLMMGIERDKRNWGGEGCKEEREGKWEGRRRGRGTIELKQPWEVAFVARKHGNPMAVNTAMIIKVAIRFLSFSISNTLQIPFPGSFLVLRIIECFWTLHSSAASCLFLILFLVKEGNMSQTIFCSFSFPIDIQDLLTHCLMWNPLLAICKMCVCHLSTCSSRLHIVSPSVYFIDEGRAKKKHFSINFCWRLSVLGHGLGQVSWWGG